MASVVVVGSFNVDHVWQCDVLPAPGATLVGRYLTGPGGKGFNQAMASARAGAATHFLCALGDDAGGVLARALAAATDIDLRAQASTAPTGTAGIYVDSRGRNCIVIGAGANAELSPEFVERQRAVIDGASILLTQLESPLDSVLAALRLAREGGACTTLLNPAPANVVATKELLALADILSPNETEFSALLGRHVGERMEPDDVAACDGARLHGLCRELLRHGSVVLTLGAAGVFVSHPEDSERDAGKAYYRIGAEQVSVVDTTGAGDAFNGALAASLGARPEQPFIEHVRYANRYAGLSTERLGAALAMPDASAVAKRFGEAAG
jgi:ribokinase